MLKKHKNQLFEVIKEEGYNNNDFEFKRINDKVDRIQVIESSLFFDFYQEETSFEIYKFMFSKFTPTARNTNISNAEYFNKVILNFKNWLKAEVNQFIAEREGEDLFENFANRTEFDFENFDNDIHTNFNSEEITFIKSKLVELTIFIKQSFEASEEQSEKIQVAINYLTDSLEKKSKFDWRGLLVSTIFSVITTLTLDTQKGAELWNYTLDLFRQIRLLK